MKLRVLFALALLCAPAIAQTDTTLVGTPSGSTHGALVNGNVPCAVATAADASGRHTLGDCNLPASHVSTDTNTQTLQNKSISGSQNTLSNVPDAALSSNVDLLNAAQSTTALKTFTGGLALPGPSNPTGSNLFLDSNGSFNIANSNGTFTTFGGCWSSDCTRPWFKNAFGVGVQESSANGTPLEACQRNEFYNGGSVLSFCINAIDTEGKGVTTTTSADAALGATSITVVANSGITSGMNVFGPGVATGTTVSSYSAGALVISAGLTVALPAGTTISFQSTTGNIAPTNKTTTIQGQCSDFGTETGTKTTCVALSGYSFKYFPSDRISFGTVTGAYDFTGRESSVARGGVVGMELDAEASGPDDALARIGLEVPMWEAGPSADGPTSFLAGVRVRPEPIASGDGLNPATIINGFFASTMTGVNGEFGNFTHAFNADGGCTVGCYDLVSGAWTGLTTALASSGQAKLQFQLNINPNAGQLVTGSPNIPSGTTVSAVYQCLPTHPVSGCAGDTNVTDVILSANLTGNIAGGTTLTFGGTFNDGSNFNGWFTDAFANWTNTNGTGYLKAGTTSNAGTVLDIQGFGEDSTNTTNIAYGDILFKESTNTHGAVVGEIDINPEGSGAVKISGSTIGSNAFTSTAYAPLASPTFTGTVTLPDGTACAASCTMGNNLSLGTHAISSVSNVNSKNASGFQLLNNNASSTLPTFAPNISDQKAGIGADTAGDLSFIADNGGTPTEILRVTGNGFALKSGAFTGIDNGTWGSGGINGSAIGGTTPAAGSFTTIAASSTVSGSGFSTYLASPPAIGGTAAAAGTFTALTNTGHVISNGAALSCSTLVFGTGAGTSPSCTSVSGDDHKFNALVATGTSPGTSAAVWTITFGSAYGSSPNCVLTPAGFASSSAMGKVYLTSTTATVVLNVNGSALAASTNYSFNVQCTG